MQIWSLIISNLAMSWTILALLLIALEVAAPGMHLIWFGIAAGIVAIIAATTMLGWETQAVLFPLISVALLVFGRKLDRRRGEGAADAPSLNERGQANIGRIVTVAEAFSGGRGRVQVGDTVWPASGPDLPAGASARVTAFDGTVMQVERA